MRLEKPGLMADVKVGDYVVIRDSRGICEPRVEQVTEVTQRTFKAGKFRSFWKTNALCTTRLSSHMRLMATPASKAEIIAAQNGQKDELRGLLEDLVWGLGEHLDQGWSPLPLSTLRDWKKALDATKD